MAELNSPITINEVVQKVNELDARESLPSQAGQGGKFLTTNGATASWDSLPSDLPDQTGNFGKFLKTNGTVASWDNVPSGIPAQTGNANKLLSTDGSSPYWLQKEYLRNLTSTQATQLLTDGTYNGETVTTGEVFTKDDGSFQEFTDTVLPPTVGVTALGAGTGNQLYATDGTVLAYTDSGKVYKSTDTGATFTEVASGLPSYSLPGSLLNTISNPFKYLNGKWIILETNGQSAYVSTDLVNWSLVTFSFNNTNIPNTYKKVWMAYNGSVYVLGFRSSNNNNYWIYYSSDFENWTTCSTFLADFQKDINSAFAVCNGYFYSVGHVDGNWGIIKSADGNTWTRVATGPERGANLYSHGNTIVVITNYSSAAYYLSTDGGATWSHPTSPLPYNPGAAMGLCYSDGLWLLSYTLSGMKIGFKYSTDLLNWTSVGTEITLSNYYTPPYWLYLCNNKFISGAGYKVEYVVPHTYTLTDLSYNKTSVDTALSGKQATLTAGTGIDITGNVISATGGAGSLEDIATAGDGIKFEGNAINYTLYGTPIIDSNYVASNFSENDRILPTMVGFAGQTFSNLAHSYPWEFKTKINLTTVGVWNAIFGGIAGSWGIDFYVDSSNRLAMNLSSNGTNYSLSGGEDNVHGTTTLSANTDYWLKCGWDGSKYYAELSTDGTNYTTGELSFTSSTPIYNSSYDTYLGYRYQNYLHGSISLPDTSFSFNNGQFEWGVVETGKTVISADIGSGASSPTTSTAGYVGKLYITTGGDVYICTGESGGSYSWKQVSVS